MPIAPNTQANFNLHRAVGLSCRNDKASGKNMKSHFSKCAGKPNKKPKNNRDYSNSK